MNENKLDDWLAAARSDLSERTPDLLLEQRVLSRMREKIALQSIATAQHNEAQSGRRIRARRTFNWFAPSFAVGAAAVLAIGVAFFATTFAPAAPGTEATLRTPFFALVASEAIAAEPSAVLVSSQVSAATLADYGLPLDPARVDRAIGAEFLVSPTGIVLAVRFTE